MNEKKPTSRADELAAWLRQDADEAEQFGSEGTTEAALKEREAADLIDSLSQLVKPRIVTNAAAIIKAVAKPCI